MHHIGSVPFLCYQHGHTTNMQAYASVVGWLKSVLIATFGLTSYIIEINSLAIICIEYCIILAQFLFLAISMANTIYMQALWHQTVWLFKTVSDGNIWAEIILYWNQTAGQLYIFEYYMIGRQFSILCNQHGQHNPMPSINDINKLGV